MSVKLSTKGLINRNDLDLIYKKIATNGSRTNVASPNRSPKNSQINSSVSPMRCMTSRPSSRPMSSTLKAPIPTSKAKVLEVTLDHNSLNFYQFKQALFEASKHFNPEPKTLS